MTMYNLIANMAVEVDAESKQQFEEDLASVFVNLVEEYGGRCGGGFELKEY